MAMTLLQANSNAIGSPPTFPVSDSNLTTSSFMALPIVLASVAASKAFCKAVRASVREAFNVSASNIPTYDNSTLVIPIQLALPSISKPKVNVPSVTSTPSKIGWV